ncbi:hypothetical protein DFH11DRAFT_1884237, partial [Phellopilus nigrolimitatus]
MCTKFRGLGLCPFKQFPQMKKQNAQYKCSHPLLLSSAVSSLYMPQQYWHPDQCPIFPRSSAAFGFQQQNLTMSNNTPFNRGNTSDSTRDLYVPCRDVDTTALQYCDPQEFSCYSEGLRPSGNTRVLHSELQGPEQLPLAMPTPWRLETQNSGLDEGISRSGPSMLISAVQPPYLSFGPPHYAESNFILPPRPRGPISSILDGGTIELFRSRVPGSGRPRHENFDLAGSAATPDSRQANWSAPNDIPYSQEDPFDPPSLIYPT